MTKKSAKEETLFEEQKRFLAYAAPTCMLIVSPFGLSFFTIMFAGWQNKELLSGVALVSASVIITWGLTSIDPMEHELIQSPSGQHNLQHIHDEFHVWVLLPSQHVRTPGVRGSGHKTPAGNSPPKG